MRLAIVGSRKQMERLAQRLLPFVPANTTELVSGGAEGVDKAAEQIAHILSLPIRVFQPDYTRYGQRAPLMRNTEIVRYADEVLAVWDGESTGTMHTIRTCIKLGKPVRILPFTVNNELLGIR